MSANIRSAEIAPGDGDLLVIYMRGPVPSSILDGGFELANATAPDHYTADMTGSPWTNAAAGMVAEVGSQWNVTPFAGSQCAVIYDGGELSQPVTLNAEQYKLSIRISSTFGFNSSFQTIRVLVDGTVMGSFVPAGSSWELHEMLFTPTAGSHTVTLRGLSTTGNAANIDGVSLVPTAPILPGPGGGDVNILGYNGGLTITPPSGSPQPLTLTQCATKLPFMWAPLDQNFEATQADTAAAKTAGTWTPNTNVDNGKFGWHNAGDANRFTMAYGSQFAQSSSVGAVATWTFSGVPPGKYIAVAIYHADSDRTSQATYTVKDGGTTVKTFTQDQRVTMRYDTSATQHVEQAAVAGRRAMVLGPDPKLTAPLYTANLITITTGTTVTIAVSNTAGSGVLTANLMGLRRVIQPYPTGSVLNAPAAWCTTDAGDALAVVNFPVSPANIDTFMPFNPTAARTMKVGYGIEYHKFGRPALFYADRMRASDAVWQGSGFTVDGDQNLTAVTGFAIRNFEAEPIQRSYDGAVLPTIKENGTWTVKYTIVSGTPSVTIQKATDHGEILGTPTTPTLVGGKMVFTQTIDTRGTIHPGAANLYVQVSGGAAKVEIYGPEVPSGWTSMYHPSLIALLANRGFDVIRPNPLALSFDESEVDWADSPSETASSTMTPRTTRSFTLTSAGPANRADLLPWYGAEPGCCAVLLTTAAAHNIRTGDFIFIDSASDDGTGWGITTTLGTSTASILRGGWPMFCVRVDATHFIWLGFGPNANEVDITDPTQCITLNSSHTISGTVTVKTGRYTPHVHMAGLCNECNIRTLHINMPMAATDAYVTSLADRLAAVLGAGKKVRLGSRGNEIWNNGIAQARLGRIWEHHTQWLWDTTSHAQGAPVGVSEGYAFLAWRLQQDAVIFRARFALAGRPSTDVITVLESQLGSSSHTAQACDFSSAVGLAPFDELAVATYRDMLEANDPTNVNVGYTTNYSAGLAAVSDASAVSLLYLGQRYGLMVGLLQSHRGVLNTHPGFGSKAIVTYEGGDQNIAFGKPRPSVMYRNPLMYRKELAVLQMLQDDGGLAMEDRYVMNYPDGPEAGSQWNDFLTSFMDVGTGNPAENQNTLDMRSGETTATFGPAALSQTGGARRTWAAAPTTSVTATLAVTTGAAVLGASVAATGSGGSTTTLPKPAHLVTTLASLHTAGDGQLALQSGDGVKLGTLGAHQVYAVSAITNPGPAETILCHFRASGLTSNTLTGVAADATSADTTVAAGTAIQVRITPTWLADLQSAINNLEASTGGTSTEVVIPEVAITTNATLTGSAFGKSHVCSGTAANYSVVLPTAVGNAGRSIRFRMAPGLTRLVTLQCNGAEQIDERPTRVMSAQEAATLVADGANWRKVAGRSIPVSCSLRLANHASPGAAQVIAADIGVKILLNTVDSDPTGQMADAANNRAVCLRSGKHTVNAQGFFGNLSINRAILSIKLFRNGSDFGDFNFSGLATAYASVPWTGDIDLVAGDVVELYAYVGGGTTENLYGDTTGGASYLTIKEAAPW